MPDSIDQHRSAEPRDPSPRPSYNDIRDDFDDTYGDDLTPRGRVRRKVLVPAIGIILTGFFGLVATFLAMRLAVLDYVEYPTSNERFYIMVFNLCWMPWFIPAFALVIAGGICLMRLRRYRFIKKVAYAVAGLGLFAVPLYVFGVWALILLHNADVKREFEQSSTE